MTLETTFATAQQEAYNHLRDRILMGELPGNTRLIPAEIAAQLGLSRMPVREALRQLAAEGFVSMKPNRAAFVRYLSAAEVDELFEIRAMLESMAVRHVIPNLTPKVLTELNAQKEAMQRADRDPTRWIQLHDAFHQTICEISNRPRLTAEIARIRRAVQPYLLMYLGVFDTFEMPGHEHDNLLEALGSGDIGLAVSVMHDHVANPAIDLVRFLRERDMSESKEIQSKALAHSYEDIRSLENSGV
jgi:DNA-binding GntR family transcriptional regulator